MSDRNLTDADAAAVADAVASHTPQGRKASFGQTMNDLIHGEGKSRGEAQASKLARIFTKPGTAADTSAVDAALARVRADREAAEADRDSAVAERDAARAEREAAERDA